MSAMGRMVEEFNVPVCNSFQAKILNDQLCYEVDLNKYSNRNNIDRDLALGFSFIMDYNEDRQVIFNDNIMKTNIETGWANNFIKAANDEEAFIYLNTIGKCK